MRKRLLVASLSVCLTSTWAAAADVKFEPSKLTQRPDDWFKSNEGQTILANIVGWQNEDGGWYKHYDVEHPRPNPLPTDPQWFGGQGWTASSTIDNAATYSELRALARAIRLADKPEYHKAFDRGLDYLIASQYPNGGFPQRFKLPNNYGRMITFNDDAMTNVMKLMQDIAAGDSDFAFVSPETKTKAQKSFDKSIECVLNCQITTNGKKTIWCQQHDPVTFAPTGARAFELPAATSSESANIVMLLMSLDHPSPRVKAAVDSAIAWFEETKITGKRWGFVTGPQYEGGKDRIITDDPSAPPLWARFYDIETNKPFFVSRDGIKRETVDHVTRERRIGYAWYSISPQKAIDQYNKKWKPANR